MLLDAEVGQLLVVALALVLPLLVFAVIRIGILVLLVLDHGIVLVDALGVVSPQRLDGCALGLEVKLRMRKDSPFEA